MSKFFPVPLGIFIFILILFFWGGVYSFNEAEKKLATPISVDCTMLQSNFDEYARRSRLPIFENPQSLCYGLNMESDFTALTSQYAIGKLLEVENWSSPTFSFQGKKETVKLTIPISAKEIKDFTTGEFYKVDMMNICRAFFMMADSRAPSPLQKTFVKPEKVACF